MSKKFHVMYVIYHMKLTAYDLEVRTTYAVYLVEAGQENSLAAMVEALQKYQSHHFMNFR